MIVVPRPGTVAVVSLNFRNTEVYVQRDRVPVWRSEIGIGCSDWLLYIMRHLEHKFQLLIGLRTAENILKYALVESSKVVTARGRYLVNGEPKAIDLPLSEFHEHVLHDSLIKFHVANVFVGKMEGHNYQSSWMPQELKEEIRQNPVVLTGEFSQLKGATDILQEAIGQLVELYIPPEDPLAHKTGWL